MPLAIGFGMSCCLPCCHLPDIKLRLRSMVLALPPTPGGGSFHNTHTRNQAAPLRLLWHGRRQHPSEQVDQIEAELENCTSFFVTMEQTTVFLQSSR